MTAGLKPKHQRLALGLLAVVAIIAAGLLAVWGLRSQASYFYLPAQLLADPPKASRIVRLGGMVEEGSLTQLDDGVSVRFFVFDTDDARVPVTYSGILPDLFVEGSGVVAEGRYGADGTFKAETLLAKHDENYVPKELEEMTEAQKAQIVSEAEAGAPGEAYR